MHADDLVGEEQLYVSNLPIIFPEREPVMLYCIFGFKEKSKEYLKGKKIMRKRKKGKEMGTCFFLQRFLRVLSARGEICDK